MKSTENRTVTTLNGKSQVKIDENGKVSDAWLHWDIINDGNQLRVWCEHGDKIIHEEIHTAKDGHTFDPRGKCLSFCHDWNDRYAFDDKTVKEVIVATLEVPVVDKETDCIFVTVRTKDMKIININMGFIRSAWDQPCNLDPNDD